MRMPRSTALHMWQGKLAVRAMVSKISYLAPARHQLKHTKSRFVQVGLDRNWTEMGMPSVYFCRVEPFPTQRTS